MSYYFWGDRLKTTGLQGSSLSNHHMTTGFGPFKTHYFVSLSGNHEVSCVGNINSKMYIVLQQQRPKYATTTNGCLHNYHLLIRNLTWNADLPSASCHYEVS